MSFQHYAGGAPEGSCGQGVPRVNRTVQVQTRAVLDAIVSNKTFWNATFAPTQSSNFFSQLPCHSPESFKTFEHVLRFLVSPGKLNEGKTNGSLSTCISSPPAIRGCDAQANREVQTFFPYLFARGIDLGKGRGILDIRFAVVFCGGAFHSGVGKYVSPEQKGAKKRLLGRGPTGRTPHC
jgi:hypothetical protein